MNAYFINCHTLEELKKEYRRLAMIHHPDCGGSTATMQAINTEYNLIFPQLKDIHTNMNGETYTASKETQETPEEFINIINQLIRFEGVTIEIIGRFVWLTGDTKPYKDAIKEIGFKWHSKKIAWYLAPEDYRKRNKRQFSLDDIRQMYDSQKVATRPYEKIAMVI